MAAPLIVDLPHQLGQAEARRRIAGGVGKIESYLPEGARATHAWTGDRLDLNVSAMGQEVTARIDVRDTVVHVEMMLPPALAFFRRAIEAGLRRKGADLLEDRTKER
jgi:hypothetical protein